MPVDPAELRRGGPQRARELVQHGLLFRADLLAADAEHAALDTGVVTMTFVCDQDDPKIPSPLLSATMPVDPR